MGRLAPPLPHQPHSGCRSTPPSTTPAVSRPPVTRVRACTTGSSPSSAALWTNCQRGRQGQATLLRLAEALVCPVEPSAAPNVPRDSVLFST
ncbi:hypothetical protein NDU88_001045 [Pleurodeles waltl]|uniref:Uncharacterized protein n=1 Tax=Pleurodeles waltl TaxID=8319 RepID=A0AAV7NBG7_PLEWA|nr:hypothetical protein NDU88_001045 [Pleurodeles waltl]